MPLFSIHPNLGVESETSERRLAVTCMFRSARSLSICVKLRQDLQLRALLRLKWGAAAEDEYREEVTFRPVRKHNRKAVGRHYTRVCPAHDT